MDLIAELGAVALDALGAHRASIVGCSMGGYAAMAFVRKFPDRVTAVATTRRVIRARSNFDCAYRACGSTAARFLCGALRPG